MAELYADVIIDISHENLDRTFQYRIPERLVDMVHVGSRVLIPFGKGNRSIGGFVLGISDKPEIDTARIKDLTDVTTDDSLVEQKLISLAHYMKTTYGSTMTRSLGTVLPIRKNVRKERRRTVILTMDEENALNMLEVYRKKHQVARYRLLNELIKEKEIDYKLVTGKLNILPATMKVMTEQGVIRIDEQRVYRNTASGVVDSNKVTLNEAQKAIAEDFESDYIHGKRGGYLLFGVTGSGKTEVYMEMIETVIRQKKSIIMLIPEIALTYQTVMRFYKRFGDRVSTLHSKLTDGERYDQFERAKKHEIDIMIGPRSALFTPFDNLGLIIIDEEHEHTYKSEQMPKYHAREVAMELAALHGASVVLGSATPDITSYFQAKAGNYKLYSLKERAKNAKLPKVEVVDLRDELKNGNKSIFSESLKTKIGERLLKGEQTILFLNRRGFAGFISCRSCGQVVKCPHCDVSLTYHKNGRLVCHYCGYEQADVKSCPKCGSRYIGGMRAGTEAVEEQIKKQFPMARVLRMDKDTTRQKGDYETILSAFANHEADILVGTQMIVKGHDFPLVTLVGILAADMSLNGSDYKAAERTFQLIVQAAGRAGRDDKMGEVLIQTYQPDNHAIQLAVSQNYEEFYEEEIGYRRLMHYPPAGHMMAVLIESTEENKGQKYAVSLAESLKNGIIKGNVIVGPASATIGRISDIYRFVIYVKNSDVSKIIDAKDGIEDFCEKNPDKNIRVTFDLDPVNGY